MEFNGPANIRMLVQMAELDSPKFGDMPNQTAKDIIEIFKSIDSESAMIINYLKEIDAVLKEHGLQDKIPLWHEVKAKYASYTRVG